MVKKGLTAGGIQIRRSVKEEADAEEKMFMAQGCGQFNVTAYVGRVVVSGEQSGRRVRTPAATRRGKGER